MQMSSNLRKACEELFKSLHGTEPSTVDVLDDVHGARVHMRTSDGGQVWHAVVVASRWSEKG